MHTLELLLAALTLPGGGGYGRRGMSDQSDDYFGFRRQQRQQITEEGVAELWGTSPLHQQDE